MQFHEDLPSQSAPSMESEVSSLLRVLPDHDFQVLIFGRAGGVMAWVEAKQ